MKRTPPEGIAAKFWRNVERGSPDECWLWMGGRHNHGYGRIFTSPRTEEGAHRYSYRLHFGLTLPREMFVCHHCDNKLCVNPNHLFLGTTTDNMRDMLAKGRGKGQRQTHCRAGHPLSGDNLKRGSRGERRCLECYRRQVRESTRRYYARLREERRHA